MSNLSSIWAPALRLSMRITMSYAFMSCSLFPEKNAHWERYKIVDSTGKAVLTGERTSENCYSLSKDQKKNWCYYNNEIPETNKEGLELSEPSQQGKNGKTYHQSNFCHQNFQAQYLKRSSGKLLPSSSQETQPSPCILTISKHESCSCKVRLNINSQKTQLKTWDRKWSHLNLWTR